MKWAPAGFLEVHQTKLKSKMSDVPAEQRADIDW